MVLDQYSVLCTQKFSYQNLYQEGENGSGTSLFLMGEGMTVTK